MTEGEELNERILDYLTNYLKKLHPELDIVRVVSWQEDTFETGGCPTCSWTEVELDLIYEDSSKRNKFITLNTTFRDLMRG